MKGFDKMHKNESKSKEMSISEFNKKYETENRYKEFLVKWHSFSERFTDLQGLSCVQSRMNFDTALTYVIFFRLCLVSS